jgi:hypothetical protein
MARNNKINLGRKTPKKVIYLTCEGGTSGTEGAYIRQLCDKHNCSYVFIYKGSADPFTLARNAIDFSKKNPKRLGDNFEIWIVFDNDEPVKVKTAFDKVAEYNSALKKNYMPINIAFNSPCVEIWGLLCCGERPKQTSVVVIQSLLNTKMPMYHHTKTPRFDFDMMESGYANALDIAIAWNVSLGDAPEHSAHLFAGIYKLVKSIKE